MKYVEFKDITSFFIFHGLDFNMKFVCDSCDFVDKEFIKMFPRMIRKGIGFYSEEGNVVSRDYCIDCHNVKYISQCVNLRVLKINYFVGCKNELICVNLRKIRMNLILICYMGH